MQRLLHLATARRAVMPLMLALAILTPLAVVSVAEAQFLPAVLYGGSLKAGQKVEALVDGTVCASTTASSKGEWVMQVSPDAPCKPKPGAAISFKVDGAAATSSPAATWESGGIPKGSVQTGYALTVGGGSDGATGSSSSESGDGGSNPTLFIVAGVALLAAVGGAAWFMYQRRSTS